MNSDNAADLLAELGNPIRLRIFRLLIRAGGNGAVVGDIQKHLEIPASTLSHHLTHLARIDLIEQRRDGRQIWCRANHDLMDAVIGFLTDECCMGLPGSGRPSSESARRHAESVQDDIS